MKQPPQVSLFIQCLVDVMYPEVGEAMLRIFNKLGISTDCPVDQTCCGQPAFNAGYRKQARVAARRFITLFENSNHIVCPSGSCVHMVRHHFPELFKEDPVWLGRAQRVAQKTYELTEYLIDVLGIDDLGARYDGIVTYHDSCHPLRGLGVREQPRRLIAGVVGTRFIEMQASDRCCGFGGSFSVKYADISTAMVADKVDNIMATGADAVIGVDISCLMNIQGLLSRRKSKIKIMHIAELLAS